MSRMDRHLTRTHGDSDSAFLNSLEQFTCFLLHASLFWGIKCHHTGTWWCFRGAHWGTNSYWGRGLITTIYGADSINFETPPWNPTRVKKKKITRALEASPKTKGLNISLVRYRQYFANRCKLDCLSFRLPGGCGWDRVKMKLCFKNLPWDN